MTTIQLFAHAIPASQWEGGPNVIDGHRIAFFAHEDMKQAGYSLIGPATVQFEIPEGWDPRAQQIEALKARKEELKREFSEAVMQIDEQINKLLAIEYMEAA